MERQSFRRVGGETEQRYHLIPAASRRCRMETQRFELSGNVLMRQVVAPSSRAASFQKVARQKPNVVTQPLLVNGLLGGCNHSRWRSSRLFTKYSSTAGKNHREADGCDHRRTIL